MALIGKRSAEHALHDSTEVDPNGGFIPDASGSFEGQLRSDSADRTFNVIGGSLYPLDIKLAKTTGAVGVSELLIVHGHATGK